MRNKVGHPPLDPGPEAPFFLRVLVRDMTHADPLRRPEDAGEVSLRLQLGDSVGSDPVELFRTPMPTQQNADAWLTADGVTPAPDPTTRDDASGGGRRETFVVGALIGALATALIILAYVVWSAQGIAGALYERAVAESPVIAPDPARTRSAPQASIPVAPGPAPTPTAVPSVPAVPTGAAAVSAAPSFVTTDQFSSWVGTSPTWAKDAVVAAGLADEHYLAGSDAKGPVTQVSWLAAVAFCESHGGLPALNDPPDSWAVDGGPDLEWRQDHGRPAWRGADGRGSAHVSGTLTSGNIGFRCAQP
jgi:hypothetical protein